MYRTVISIVTAVWFTTALLPALATTAVAAAANVQLGQPTRVYDVKEMKLYRTRRDAACRINGGQGLGSGTLIAKRTHKNGKTVGVILTCAHIFNPATWEELKKRKVTAAFRHDNGEVRLCLPIAINWDNDLLALACYIHADTPIIPLAAKASKAGEDCYVCGYGPDGRYQCHIGPVRGYTSVSWNGGKGKLVPAQIGAKYTSHGKNQLYVTSTGLRDGDSGGGMVNTAGELVGVFWGGGRAYTYGTEVETCQAFLIKRLPRTYQWVCPAPRHQQPQQPQRPSQWTPPVIVPTHPAPPVVLPPVPVPVPPVVTPPVVTPPVVTPPVVTPPVVTPPVVTPPQKDKSHVVIREKLSDLQKRITSIEAAQSALKAGQNTIAAGVMTLPTKQDLAILTDAVKNIGKSQGQLHSALAQLQSQITSGSADAVITLRVESDKFISPSYVDVSVLWALQQASGIDHMVLVTDTSAAHWTTRMKGEYAAAKAKFPALIVYDVRSKGVRFKELPQLIIYPSKPGGETVIVKGTDGVSKRLQAITRNEAP